MASDDEDVPGLFILVLVLFQSSLRVPKIRTDYTVDELQMHSTVVILRLTLLQILEPCLRLAKAVSWTTNFGYAMMRLPTSLAETSILP